jgi:formamidopyrimidine-DNA glycosylase
MVGARIDKVEVRRPNLRLPFPARFAARLTGQTVTSLTRRAKYLLAALSSGETLVMHLGMSGSFRIDRDKDRNPVTGLTSTLADDRHDHVVFHLSSKASVTFNDPRRFGFMDLAEPDRLDQHPALRLLGVEPLSGAFDAAALAAACKGRRTSLKVALLDQHLVAGLGNIYVSEALHRAHLSPRRLASTIATVSGVPRPTAVRLTTAIKDVLNEAVDRASGVAYRASRFRVYDREGERCPTRGCDGTIRRFTQAGRSTFYCRVCQR